MGATDTLIDTMTGAAPPPIPGSFQDAVQPLSRGPAAVPAADVALTPPPRWELAGAVEAAGGADGPGGQPDGRWPCLCRKWAVLVPGVSHRARALVHAPPPYGIAKRATELLQAPPTPLTAPRTRARQEL